MKSKVAVVRTGPETVIRDYHRAMDLAGAGSVLKGGEGPSYKAQPFVDQVLSGLLEPAVAASRGSAGSPGQGISEGADTAGREQDGGDRSPQGRGEQSLDADP